LRMLRCNGQATSLYGRVSTAAKLGKDGLSGPEVWVENICCHLCLDTYIRRGQEGGSLMLDRVTQESRQNQQIDYTTEIV
jgi:hypothetical protein